MKKFLLTLMLMVMFAPFALHADDIAGMSRTSFAKDEVRSYTNYWTPDETVYPNNMTLTGVVQIDGEVQNTTSLEVGAFCGEELRGSYRLQYISALDKYLVFLVIYGNDSDEITFKLYDHELGQELDCQMLPESAVNFEVNKVEGNADEPFVISFESLEHEYASYFFDDFNDHNFDGWRTIDQDGDGHTWRIPNRKSYILSESYDDSNYEELNPDNYIVTTELYKITEKSVLGWLVVPSDDEYYEDHYAVVISTDNETFDVIWEETLTSFNDFEQRVLNLNEYAGQNIYIGFRHYNCNGSTVAGVLIDDVELSVIYNVTANVNPEEAGTVNGAGSYQYGETATLTATANEGYQFANWTENGEIVSEDAEYSFTVESARDLVANFELQTFNVTVTADPADYGNVTGSGSYQYGETATLTAIANDGYQFVNWTENGEVISEDAEYSFIVESARELVANFALSETVFFDDFNDGNIDGWRKFQFDTDDYNWTMANTYGISGPDNSTCLYSLSYETGVLTPDNFIVTTSKYAITSTSKFSFDVRPMNYSYIYDKYGVVVSEDNENWTVIYSEAFDGTSEQGWVNRSVDLGAYAGKEIYIGLRHYDCDGNWGTGVLVDNVELTTGYVKFIGEGSWSDASNWLNSQKPESTDKVMVNGNAVIQNGDNVSVYELCINSGKSLTIEGGASLSVTGTLANYEADALVINDGAQLFQSNENVYATYNKNIINPVGTWGEDDNTGWHFVSTPIINSQVSEFVPSTGNYDLFKYDGTQTEQWVNYKQHQDNFGTTFVQGAAYLASYETETTAVFKGIVSYNQSFDFNVSYNNDVRMANFHLLGNPFSFNMDLKNLELDGVYPAFATLDPSTGGYIKHTTEQNSTIPVGNGFFVEAIGENPSLSYNVGSKSRGEKYEYLNVIASGKQGSNNVIIKLAGAEERGFSKLENLNKTIADLYVKNNGRQYSVLGYDRDVKEVELFFDAKEMGNYSISIEPNGKFESVTLVDRMTGIETNMLMEDYSFTATANDNPNRFVLKLSNGQEPTEDSQFAYMNNGDIVIYNISGDAQINIFDALGRCVYQGESSDATTRIASVYSAGVYVIQKVDDNGVNVQKLIINE